MKRPSLSTQNNYNKKKLKSYLSFDEAESAIEIVRAGSNGWYLARCPAHYDERASLSVKEGDKGELVVFCFAGCSVQEIIKKIKESL
jgi:DNA primase